MDKTKNKLLILIISIIIISCSKGQNASSNDLRLVIASPEIAELVAELQSLDNIVGITRECNYPPSLNNIPHVGTFGKIDVEKVVALDPDIVLVAGLEQEYLASELSKLGIRVEKLFPKSFADMMITISRLAEILNKKDQAKKLIKNLTIQIDSLKSTMPESAPDIYVEIYGEPLMSVADCSFVGELVELAGFNNIFSDLPRTYSRINPEDVLKANPQYILIMYPYAEKEQIMARKGWQEIDAVKNQNILLGAEINADLLVRATPRSLEGVKKLRKILNERN